MNKSTAFFLILLRLAIGWHFLAEGYHKLDGYWHGASESVAGTNKPFSSAGYFREGTGPLAAVIRQEIGDPDEEAIEQLTPKASDSTNAAPHLRTPSPLDKRWSEYVQHFADYYDLDEKQRKSADKALTKIEDEAVQWMTRTTADEKNFTAKTQEGRLPLPTRLAQYKRKLEEWSKLDYSYLTAIGSEAEAARRQSLKAELKRLRTGLLNDLDEYTQDLRKELEKIPTSEQKRAAESKGDTPLPSPAPNEKQKWIDWATMYGLTALGACLILGLFTRLSCVLTAAFLLSTYLCSPPFPWLPAAPNNEGYYLFINKNAIEMLALLALATTASGRWLGLDAVIHWMLFGGSRPASSPQNIR
jgi:uncharacterized membrane protein YphA (DoxX/SURF4 family)